MTQMLTEIHEQPDVLRKVVSEERERIDHLASAIEARRPRFVVIAARGTSDHAAVFAKYAFEAFAGLPVALAAPSVVTLYQARLDLRDALVIGISQSGEAADVQEILSQAEGAGGFTVTITNEPDSMMSHAAKNLLLCRAGHEKALAATKTYTSELMMLGILAARLARRDDLIRALLEAPDAVERLLVSEDRIRLAVERYAHAEECVVLGRGLNYPSALEIGLKLTETALIRAKGFSSADFQHGPIAMVRGAFPALVMAPLGRSLDQMVEMTQTLNQRGADTIVFSDDARALELARTCIALPVVGHEIVSPFTTVTAGQLFANFLTITKGLNPDCPPGLNKVTVTR